MKKNNTGKTYRTKDVVFIGIMAAIICIFGPITIPLPFSPIPISFTNLAIYLTIFSIGLKKGTISYLIYLLLGMVGLPVFSQGGAGIGKVLGPTGGYLIGFIFMAIIFGIFLENFQGKLYMYIIGMILGMVVAYGFGTAWLSYQSHMSFSAALTVAVLPFLPGDLIKIIIGAICGPILRKRLITERIRVD